MKASISWGTSRASRPTIAVGDNESVYSFLCRHGLTHPGWRDQIGHLLGSVFAAPLRYFGQHAERLGVSDEWLRKAFGDDLTIYLIEGVPALERHLRYCPECMKQSYHSALFQHYAVARCPFHDVALRVTCPSCEKPILPTFFNIENSPYECPACHHDLRRPSDLRTGLSPGPSAQSLDKALEPARASLRADGSAGAVVHCPLPKPSSSSFMVEPTSAADSRYWQRALIFPGAQSAWGARFREIIMHILADERDGYDDEVTRDLGAANVIKWLRTNSGCADQVDYLISRFGNSPGGMVVAAAPSLLAMVLYKFLCHYGMVKGFTELGEHGNVIHDCSVRYGPRFVEAPRLDQRLMELEMLGAIAVELARFGKMRLIDAELWWRGPKPLVFAPSAVVDEQSGRVRVRYRADEATVQRLMQRLENRPFRLSADEMNWAFVRLTCDHPIDQNSLPHVRTDNPESFE
jgi:hypothetical protein